MANSKKVKFNVEPLKLHKSDTSAKCLFTICTDDCKNSINCNADIPINKRHFIMPTNTPTEPPKELPNKEQPEIQQEINHQDIRECSQKFAVWESEKTHRGILKVKAHNPEMVGTQCISC